MCGDLRARSMQWGAGDRREALQSLFGSASSIPAELIDVILALEDCAEDEDLNIFPDSLS